MVGSGLGDTGAGDVAGEFGARSEKASDEGLELIEESVPEGEPSGVKTAG